MQFYQIFCNCRWTNIENFGIFLKKIIFIGYFEKYGTYQNLPIISKMLVYQNFHLYLKIWYFRIMLYLCGADLEDSSIDS